MPSFLSHQFAIATNPSKLPESWPQRQLGSYYLASAADLPCIEVRYPNQQVIALLLGWPVTPEAVLLNEHTPWILPLNISGKEFETKIYQLGGRWVCLTTTDNGRLYLDPMASQPCIVCPVAGLILSSAALLPEPWKSNLDHELMAQMNVENSENFYLFSVLPQRDCYRALANHYVDLTSLQQIRHWPSELNQHPHSLAESAEIVGNVVKNHIEALHHILPTKIGLSAGFETRVMLACAKSYLINIKFWTRIEKKYKSVIDQQIATLLASSFHLNHELISTPTGSTKIISAESWLHSTGNCIGGSALKNRALIDQDEGTYFALTGLGGEICRAFYRLIQGSQQPLTPELLTKVAGVPFNSQFQAAGVKYLATMPDLPLAQQLSLFYLEIRMGAYGSPHKYGNQHGIIFIYPLNHRDSVQEMLTLPEKQQYKNALHKAVIMRFWPELATIPFNEPVSHPLRYTLRVWGKIKKTLRWLQCR